MLFTSRAYLAAVNALLAEHSLGLTELVPQNPFAAQLKSAVISVLRMGSRTPFDQGHWINIFNHENRTTQLNIVAMALNELGHSPMLFGELWRPVKNPFIIRDVEGKLDRAAQYIQRRHGEVIRLRSSRLTLEAWGLADVHREPESAQPGAEHPSLHFMAELPHPDHNKPLRMFGAGGLTFMYYEHPETIGRIAAGIAPPYRYPHMVVVSVNARPRLIVRTEQDARGGLVLCTMDPDGRHSNLGLFPATSADAFIKKAVEVAANYKQ